ncbi:unnamed protein product [Cylicocyclus nassatus]|uniref:Uncharacterized protein n=1 Tax=Cylicocyclus nassatus TaxID=53992 RepID=A0AA36GV46_CYLNA|nr:unnamed protein product [Cylicocyclus nassatus]
MKKTTKPKADFDGISELDVISKTGLTQRVFEKFDFIASTRVPRYPYLTGRYQPFCYSLSFNSISSKSNW